MESLQDKLKSVWPEWEILEKIGEGSFGVVFKAVRRDLAGVSFAAIKAICIPRDEEELEELKAEGLTLDQSYSYFRRVVRDYTAEIKLMDSVKGYTNIVSIDDYKIVESEDQMAWYIFIRMELLTPLMKKAAADGITEEDIVRAGIDLCTALDICRKKSIIHRDIKPQNIFVNDEGHYKLGDFGVARCLDRTSGNLSRKGAPNYMAPELYKTALQEISVDDAAKVDIYSLGLVLFWMGNRSRLPFVPMDKQIVTPEDRETAFFRRVRGEALPGPAETSPELRRIILKACEYRPEDRYASAAEMKEDLLALREKQNSGWNRVDIVTTESRPGTSPAAQPKAKPKKRGLLILLIGVLIIAAAVAGLLVSGVLSPKPAADPDILVDPEPPSTPAFASTQPDPSDTPTPVPTPTPSPEQTAAPAFTPEPAEEPEPESTPTPVPSFTPEPTSLPVSALPKLTDLYPGADAHLHEFRADRPWEKISLYAGPGTDYGEPVRIAPKGQKKVTVFFNENGWIFTHIVHEGTRVYLYVPLRFFDYPEKLDLPEVDALAYTEGTVTKDTVPRWGPERDLFKEEEGYAAQAGTPVKVFFREGKYVYAEYSCNADTVRMWLLSESVELAGANGNSSGSLVD